MPPQPTLRDVPLDTFQLAVGFLEWEDLIRLEMVCRGIREMLVGWDAFEAAYRFAWRREGKGGGRRTLRLEHLPLGRVGYRCCGWRNEVFLNARYASALRCRQSLPPAGDEVWNVSWSPCGHFLATGSRHGEVTFFRLTLAGNTPRLLPLHKPLWRVTHAVAMLDWSPHSSYLLVTTTADAVLCYSVAEGRVLPGTACCVDFDCYARWVSPTRFVCGYSRSTLVSGHPSSHSLGLYSVEGGVLHLLRTTKVAFDRPDAIHCPVPVTLPSGRSFALFSTGAHDTGQSSKAGLVPLTQAAKDWWDERGDGEGCGDLQETFLKETSPVGLHDFQGPIIGLSVHRSNGYVLLNVRPFSDCSGNPQQNHQSYIPRPLSQEVQLVLTSVAEFPKPLRTFSGHRGFSACASPFLSWPSLSPHSPHVAVGSEDNKIYVYNVHHEDVVCTLEGHTKLVNCVAYHPKLPGVLASCSDDGTTKLWAVHDVVSASSLSEESEAFCASLPRME